MQPSNARYCAALSISFALLVTAGAAFWYQDWQYSLPTARPAWLRQPPVGQLVDLRLVLGSAARLGRPVVVHVVDPGCPCSRFNRDHLRSLARRFGRDVGFVALVEGHGDGAALVQAFEEWGLGIQAVADPGGERAARLGAYSTPQAILVRADGRIYFRGNYNSSRYHAERRTEFARLALERLLAGDEPAPQPREATESWGCALVHAETAAGAGDGTPAS